MSTKRENCCRFVFSNPSLTFKALPGGQNSSFGKSWERGRLVTTAVAFTGSSVGGGQNLRVDQVEICLCAKIHPNPSLRCCVKLFQSWSLSSVGGGRTAHFGLCVAVARSCVGLESCRAGVSRARAVPASAPPLLLCRLCCCRKTTATESPAAALDRICWEARSRSRCMVGGLPAGAGTGNFKQNAGCGLKPLPTPL